MPLTHLSDADRDRDAIRVLKRENEQMRAALKWVSDNYKTTLACKPVRDADECLLYADKLLEETR